MGLPPSRTIIWLKRGLSAGGFLLFLAGLNWLWQIRDIWPRATTDPVPHSCMEAIGVVIGGLYLVNRGR
jgi:hypothetical protein